jgi:hypothetical protein
MNYNLLQGYASGPVPVVELNKHTSTVLSKFHSKLSININDPQATCIHANTHECVGAGILSNWISIEIEKSPDFSEDFAERAGFEPAIQFPIYTLSRRAPSTTRTPLPVLQGRRRYNNFIKI